MTLLALDQSSKITGYAIFENQELIQHGVINLSSIDDIGKRLLTLREYVEDLITDYSVNKIAFEDIQLQSTVGNNVKTFKVLAEVFGVIHELCYHRAIPCQIVPSVTWKSYLNIKGKTRPEQKAAAKEYVCGKYLDLVGHVTQDECDAICIGTYAAKGL